MREDVQVFHYVLDSLPGDAPAMYVVSEGRVDSIVSRAATHDEIAAALDPMYVAMSCTAMALHAVA